MSTARDDRATGDEADSRLEVTSDSIATTLAGGSGTDDDADANADSSTGESCDLALPCGNWINLECGNGMDDDGDGLVDLADPECTSVCDDDEGSFADGLPTDNFYPCKLDCFFDGNTGQGDDGCIRSLECDPLEPLPNICPYYRGSNQCQNVPDEPTPQCVAFCEPFVPNGCDCFGCCTFDTPQGPKNVLVYEPACMLADGLIGCGECTQVIDQCGNPCEPNACEICIGQTEPPPGCDAPACVGGVACTSPCDCARGEACITGCCIAPIP
jgi:hypothetical protein